MQTLQYFVFDKTGNKILEASGIPCSSTDEVRDLANTMKDNFIINENNDFDDTQLLISCGNEILFDSLHA